VISEVALLGGHADLIQLLNYLHAQVSDTLTITSAFIANGNSSTPTSGGNVAQSGKESNGASMHTTGTEGRADEPSSHSAQGSEISSSGTSAVAAPPSSFPRVDSL
jgi:hypothetical protein